MKEEILSNAKELVAVLIGQYKEYLATQEQVRKLSSDHMDCLVSIAKSTGRKISEIALSKQEFPAISELTHKERALSERLQHISDEMTFANPVVWLMYKHTAYLGTPGAIQAWRDMKKHCSKPGYICTKRFQHMTSYIMHTQATNLEDIGRFPDDLLMSDFYQSDLITELVADKNFMEGWSTHEFHHDGLRVAKWENFTT
jgi:hypothetical protein